jgi:hypothetical protein
MSSWQPVSGMIGQAIDVNSATLTGQLGRTIQARDMASTDYGMGQFIYLKGLDATAVGSVVTFNSSSFQTALAVANAKGQIAFAMSACVTGEYGWYQIYGKCVAKVAALFASGNVPYLTATPGTIDDAVVAGDAITGSVSVSAIATPAAGLALISVSYPTVTDESN